MRKGRPNLDAAEEQVELPVNEEIADMGSEVVEEAVLASVSAPEQAPRDEKYYRIQLHEKSRQEDSDNVYVAVNGECLYLKRGTEVILPQRFLEVLNNAIVPQYSLDADENGRARSGSIRRVTFTPLGPATREEFLKMKADGKKALERAAMAASAQQQNGRLR